MPICRLDAAWLRVGDPRDEVRRRRERDAAAADREIMSDVVDHLVAADDGDLRIMSMLRGQDLRQTLDTGRDADRDPLAGVFAHVVVDEAQELTDAEWAMVLRRCSGASLTIVGDRAQARAGFAEPWTDRLRRIGLDRFHVAELTVNYRTPAEVMSVAEPVIRAAIPDANVPRAIRRSGFPVRRGRHPTSITWWTSGWRAMTRDGRGHRRGPGVVSGSRCAGSIRSR